LNRETFEFANAKVGVNYPPFHPFCRTNVVLIENGNSIQGEDESWYTGSKVSEALNDKNDPTSKRREAHVKRHYESVRNRENEKEITTISANSGLPRELVFIACAHIFINEYMLDGEKKRFAPDYYMPQFWQRLREGKGIFAHGLLLFIMRQKSTI
jgi:hypothetical protein